jgi:hypothetical protein
MKEKEIGSYRQKAKKRKKEIRRNSLNEGRKQRK